MRDKKRPSAVQLKERADLLTMNGITTRETYFEALPLLFSIRQAAASIKAFAKALEASAETLSEGAAAYAKDHTTALDEPLHEAAKGKTVGTVVIGTNRYTLTLTDGPLKRESGDNLTEDFLKGLPKGWTKIKHELDVTSINQQDVDKDDLFKHGLIRTEKRAWTMKTAAEAADWSEGEVQS